MDWLMAVTEAGMLTDKQKMKSRTVEECEKSVRAIRNRREVERAGTKGTSHGCGAWRSVGR